MKTPSSATRCLLLLATGLLLLPAHADISLLPGKKKDKERKREQEAAREKLSTMSPEVKSGQVNFVMGRTVDIPLQAATATVSGLRFLIREQPKFGTLSEIRLSTENPSVGIVTYTHNGGPDLADSFSYACKVGEGSYSAPGVVTLMGQRPEPKLEVTKQPFFGKVLPGTEMIAKFEVTNKGIGPFVGEIAWQAPWKGPPRIELKVGQTQEFAVAVTPTVPGILTWETYLQPGADSSRLRLWIQCEQSFVVAPSRARMSYDEETGGRKVKVQISNSTPAPIHLTLDKPSRLKGPAELELEGTRMQEVEFTLAPDDVAAFRGEVLVNGVSMNQRVTVEADPEPAQIQLANAAQKTLDFGKTEMGASTERKLAVRNVGGVIAAIKLQALPPLSVPAGGAYNVEPGATLEIPVMLSSEKTGTFSNELVFSGNGGELKVPVRAVVFDPKVADAEMPAATTTAQPAAAKGKAAPSPAKAGPTKPAAVAAAPLAVAGVQKPKPAPRPAAGGAADTSLVAGMINAYLGAYGPPIDEALMNKELGRVEQIRVEKITTDEIELSWPVPEGKALISSYQVEQGRQMYAPAAQMWLPVWRVMSEAKPMFFSEGRVGVRLSGLTASSQYQMRIRSMDADGKLSESSDVYTITTAAPFHFPDWLWQLLLVIAFAGLGYTAFQLRQGRWKLREAV
ncbi:MAG: fibronectin type III domain-containing protein [Verrucomicrobiales bacterium]|nr:fibronectin type III domain-containing protein [Verrucomicrobiales bacterium]MCP5556458.1 fibronectin type III domain-containing protein [Verrucomicrobiaceae bacterium]